MKKNISQIISSLEKALIELKKEVAEKKAIKTPLFAELIKDIDKHQAMYMCWKKWHSFGKRKIGKLYERFVGYKYTLKGYTVHYLGLTGKDKLKGIDLRAENDKEILLIQCKCHTHTKIFHSDIIDKLGGAIAAFKKKTQTKKSIRGIFYTSAGVADEAKQEASLLGIEIIENEPYNPHYPQIKCNISLHNEKRYFLPWVPSYDNVIIEPEKGEFFADSVLDAVDVGFKRAKAPPGLNKHIFDFWRYCRREKN